jgi:transposase-like protein
MAEQEMEATATVGTPALDVKTKRNSVGLSPGQLTAIDLIVAGQTYKSIAEQVGVHYNTLAKWRMNKNFVKELNKSRKEAIKGAQAIMATNASYAAERIIQIMDDPEATRTQLAAARLVYEYGIGTSVEEFEERMEKLEESITRQV